MVAAAKGQTEEPGKPQGLLSLFSSLSSSFSKSLSFLCVCFVPKEFTKQEERDEFRGSETGHCLHVGLPRT